MRVIRCPSSPSRDSSAQRAAGGKLLAERFGAELLDRAIVAQVAVRSGIPEAEIESYDERMPSFWQRVTALWRRARPSR